MRGFKTRNNSGLNKQVQRRTRKREHMAKREFVPRRKLGGGQKMYRKWDDYRQGDVVIGKYIDTYQDAKYDKPCWVLEVIDAQFKTEKADKYIGKNLVLNSAGMLDKAMKKTTIGAVVQVVYNGKTKMEGGKFKGKDSHLMDIDEVEETSEEAPEL